MKKSGGTSANRLTVYCSLFTNRFELCLNVAARHFFFSR